MSLDAARKSACATSRMSLCFRSASDGSQGKDFHSSGYLVVREREYVVERGLEHLPQEMTCAGGGDDHSRNLPAIEFVFDAGDDVANFLRRERDDAVLFAVLDGALDGLLVSGIEEICGQ